MSQDELLKRLERQRKRGAIAERFVVEFERRRLFSLDRPDLAGKVEQVSIDDACAGYDIKSFEKNENPRFIEVKSSVGSQVSFEWSKKEREKAAKEEDSYFIYFVPFSFSLPNLIAPMVLLRNPIKIIQSGRLTEIPSRLQVIEPKPNERRPLRQSELSTTQFMACIFK